MKDDRVTAWIGCAALLWLGLALGYGVLRVVWP